MTKPLVTSENFGKLLLESAQQAARYSLIARLMAGIETPDDLDEAEQAEHEEDLLEFLQAELDAAGKVTTRKGTTITMSDDVTLVEYLKNLKEGDT